MPLDRTDDKSTLVQVMAWCHQATSHYLNQCWPRFMSPCGVTRPQWVNSLAPGRLGCDFKYVTFCCWYLEYYPWSCPQVNECQRTSLMRSQCCLKLGIYVLNGNLNGWAPNPQWWEDWNTFMFPKLICSLLQFDFHSFIYFIFCVFPWKKYLNAEICPSPFHYMLVEVAQRSNW